MKKYRKIIIDLVFNVGATAVPLIVLQLVIFPSLALQTSEEFYGFILTIISIVTVLGASLGNALNNVRLIRNNEYEQKGYNGDFSILLICELVIGGIVISISLLHYNLEKFNYFLIIIMTLLWILEEYYCVAYRLELKFGGIAINNFVMVIGYAVGFVLFYFTGYWQLIYIIGIVFSIFYINKSTNIIREKINRTPLFGQTIKELLYLVIACLIANLLNYADRMIIYPLVGGTAVAVYYASTLFGKIVSTAVIPLNSVMLSYLAKKNKMAKKMFNLAVKISFVVAILGYIICRLIAYPALCIIYPKLAEESIRYVPVTTAIAMVTMIINVMSPFVLKFCEMKWQIVINLCMLVIYIISALILYSLFGLMGFCIGVLISNLVKMMIMYVLGNKAGE